MTYRLGSVCVFIPPLKERAFNAVHRNHSKSHGCIRLFSLQQPCRVKCLEFIRLFFFKCQVQHGDCIPSHVGQCMYSAFRVMCLAFLEAHQVSEKSGLVSFISVLQSLPGIGPVLLGSKGVDLHYFFQCLQRKEFPSELAVLAVILFAFLFHDCFLLVNQMKDSYAHALPSFCLQTYDK